MYKFSTNIHQCLSVIPELLWLLSTLRTLQHDCNVIKVTWHSEPFEFDFSDVKAKTLACIQHAHASLQQTLTDFMYGKIAAVVDFYTTSSKKLYGQDHFVQMCNLVEVKEM